MDFLYYLFNLILQFITEIYYGFETEYSSFNAFAVAIEEYINYYNNRRIQKKTKWMPPVKYREASMCLG